MHSVRGRHLRGDCQHKCVLKLRRRLLLRVWRYDVPRVQPRLVFRGQCFWLYHMPSRHVFAGQRVNLCELQPGPVLPCRLQHQRGMLSWLLLPQRFSAAADTCWILLWPRRHRPYCLPALLFSRDTPYALCSWLHGRRQPVQ